MKTYYALITLLILVLFTSNKLVAQEEVTEGLGAVSYTHLTLPTTPYV